MREEELEALRRKHQLRALTDGEEGFGIQRLPNGVYGFAYGPTPHRDFPLFQTNRFHTFEVHKLSNGEIVLVGFVTPQTATEMESATKEMNIRLFPAPREEASALVSVPLSRVIHFKELSARETGGLDMRIDPVSMSRS